MRAASARAPANTSTPLTCGRSMSRHRAVDHARSTARSIDSASKRNASASSADSPASRTNPSGSRRSLQIAPRSRAPGTGQSSRMNRDAVVSHLGCVSVVARNVNGVFNAPSAANQASNCAASSTSPCVHSATAPRSRAVRTTSSSAAAIGVPLATRRSRSTISSDRSSRTATAREMSSFSRSFNPVSST